MATVKVNINQSAINKLTKGAVNALEKTAEAVKTDVINAQVIPFDMGTLQNESTFIYISKGKVSIVSDTPYARRLYHHPEFNFQKVNNKNAKGEWFKDWIEGDKKDFAQEAFKKFYKQETGV